MSNLPIPPPKPTPNRQNENSDSSVSVNPTISDTGSDCGALHQQSDELHDASNTDQPAAAAEAAAAAKQPNFTICINGQVLSITSISININNVHHAGNGDAAADAAVPAAAAAHVEVEVSELSRQQGSKQELPQTARGGLLSTIRKVRFGFKSRNEKPAKPAPASAAAAAAAASGSAAAASAAAGVGSNGTLDSIDNNQQNTAASDSSAALACEAQANSTDPGELYEDTVESDSEVDMTDEPVVDNVEKTPTEKKRKESNFAAGLMRNFSKAKKDGKDASQSKEATNFKFPDDLPDSAKSLYEIRDDTSCITTLYSCGCKSNDSVKKLKKFLSEGESKKLTIGGKSRSVWLNPQNDEEMEIWKEYLDENGDAVKALARVVGTDRYGFIVIDEINNRKQMDTSEETAEYSSRLEKLMMFQGEYGNDGDM